MPALYNPLLTKGAEMHICLSHWTALECWRQIRLGGAAAVGVMLDEQNARFPWGDAPMITHRDALQFSSHLGLTLPLQLGIRGFKRNKREYCEFKLIENEPAVSTDVCELENGVFLPYPETVFMQLAVTLSVLDLARLGYELTSSYVARPQSMKIEASVPLLDVQLLKQKTKACSKRAQHNIARALAFVAPGAESPAEIELALKLFAPGRYGGFGLKGGQLNPRVELSKNAQLIAGKSHCRADIFFADARIDVEYDSKAWHSTEEQQINDMTRRMALRQEGYKVLPISAEDIRRPEKLHEIAAEVCHAQGKRLRLNGKDFEKKQEALFQQLSSGFKPVSRP